MEKLKMHTPDLTQDHIARIREMFPNCVTEAKDAQGAIKLAVDFDLLKQELSGQIVEGPQERYHLNWPGKREALLTANAPIAKTLRPARDESVNFDTTKNLFIEGDNLEALKLLQETYLGKIKMIYIDPPYNTENDFVYMDDFAEDTDEYLQKSLQVDDQGARLVANPETNGRKHSDWLSMIFSRLKLARNLLSDDGLIFISISDHEVANLRRMCDEVFGEQNFIGSIMWNSTKSVTNTALISVGHTYNLVFAKNRNYFKEHRSHFRLAESGDGFSNPDNDPRGPWKADPFQVGGWRPNQQYEVINPKTGEKYLPNEGCSWKNDLDNFKKLMADNRIVFGTSGEAGPQRKRFLSEAEERGKVSKTWWDDVGTTTNGTVAVKNLFDGKSVFSNPKPVDLIKRFIELGDHTRQGIIMDFFSGSSTTAHAVLELNAEDNGNRRHISIQLPEKLDIEVQEQKIAAEFCKKLGIPETISEISKERIRRAGKKIQEENPLFKGDTGFRVLKIDTSNMADIYYVPDAVKQSDLLKSVDNIKPDRNNAEDLLFQVLLDWGVDLTLPIAREKLAGKQVYFVDGNALAACFETGVSEDFVKELAARKPLRVVFRDNGFTSDAVKINVDQIFKQLSPATEVRSI